MSGSEYAGPLGSAACRYILGEPGRTICMDRASWMVRRPGEGWMPVCERHVKRYQADENETGTTRKGRKVTWCDQHYEIQQNASLSIPGGEPGYAPGDCSAFWASGWRRLARRCSAVGAWSLVERERIQYRADVARIRALKLSGQNKALSDFSQ